MILVALAAATLAQAQLAPSPASGARPYEDLVCTYRDWDCQKAMRVMLCENDRSDPRAYSAGNYGLFQIAYRYHAQRVDEASDLYDPAINIAIAHQIYAEQGWGPWPRCGGA